MYGFEMLTWPNVPTQDTVNSPGAWICLKFQKINLILAQILRIKRPHGRFRVCNCATGVPRAPVLKRFKGISFLWPRWELDGSVVWPPRPSHDGPWSHGPWLSLGSVACCAMVATSRRAFIASTN